MPAHVVLMKLCSSLVRRLIASAKDSRYHLQFMLQFVQAVLEAGDYAKEDEVLTSVIEMAYRCE